jgi:multidrug efflux system outer membrane protein
MRGLKFVVAAAPALLLGACDLAPAYDPPAVALSAAYKNGDGAGAGGVIESGAWWSVFHDRALDGLEAQVDSANQDLAAAMAAYAQARAYEQAAESGLYPQIQADLDISTDKQSSHRPLRSATQPNYYGANQLDAQASWEIDVWGRVHDLVSAARAEEQASADALAEARLSIHAELARDYISLRGLDLDEKLIADTIANYRNALKLTQSRLAGQIAPPIDVERAEVQLHNVLAEASYLASRRASLENAVATLVGRSAASFTLPRAAAAIAQPRRPRTAPSDVLRRRPDVALREREVAAANERIGVANAAFYPRFTINLLGGTQDTGINLASLKNSLYSIGPSVSLPLFDAGLRKADLDAARAAYDEAVANYRQSVLRAVQDVDDGLSALRWLTREFADIQASADAAQKASDLSLSLYREGASNYLDVVTAQNAALDAKRRLIALQTSLLQANVSLILALGGGWAAEPTRLASH